VELPIEKSAHLLRETRANGTWDRRVAIIGSQVGVHENELASDGVVVCMLCVCFAVLDVKCASVSVYLFRFAQIKTVSGALQQVLVILDDVVVGGLHRYGMPMRSRTPHSYWSVVMG
jgi:hypothetical protein